MMSLARTLCPKNVPIQSPFTARMQKHTREQALCVQLAIQVAWLLREPQPLCPHCVPGMYQSRLYSLHISGVVNSMLL